MTKEITKVRFLSSALQAEVQRIWTESETGETCREFRQRVMNPILWSLRRLDY